MIPCILMLISVGIGLATLILTFITSFLLSIFAGLILSAKGVLCTILIVILPVSRLIFRFKREREEEEGYGRHAAAAKEARKERETRERGLRQLQEALRQAELRERRSMAGNSLGEQQPFERTGPTSSMDTSMPQRVGWVVNLIEAIGRASSAVASVPADLDDRGIGTEDVSSLLGGDCVMCCVRAADTLVMPCKHLALCGACSSKMRIGSSETEGRCPLCRARIVDKMKIFRS